MASSTRTHRSLLASTAQSWRILRSKRIRPPPTRFLSYENTKNNVLTGLPERHIVTCGTDDNGYVWSQEDGAWKPTLVILRINRAAAFVNGSPLEDKFAVGGGARLVCFFESENDWGVSKHVRKPIRSTVLRLAWRRHNMTLAAGPWDFRCRVFSACIKEVDEKPTSTPRAARCLLGSSCQILIAVSLWEPPGPGRPRQHFSVADASKCVQVLTLKMEFLPLLRVSFVSEVSVVAAGHDCCPVLFNYNDLSCLIFISKLDIPKQGIQWNVSPVEGFRSMDRRATTEGCNMALETLHQKSITQVSVYEVDKQDFCKFCTAVLDRRMTLWDFKTLGSSIQGLQIM
ncbi:Actin-related protein 2/3 complex subunit 1A [Plecturocebus cupreus]